jgi:hypothetical protein
MASRKKSEKILEKLQPRQRQYVKNRVAGKSKKTAALEAGFSESMAENAAAKIETSDVREAFRKLVQQEIPASKIVARLKEGLDAMETKLFQKDGIITDARDLVEYSERRNYLELAAKMGGYYIEKQEIEDVTDRPMDEWTDAELKVYVDTGARPSA